MSPGRMSCYSADSPCRRHTITDPAKASPKNQKLKYNWWEYKNNHARQTFMQTNSQSTMVTNFHDNNSKKNDNYVSTFKESCGLIKLKSTAV